MSNTRNGNPVTANPSDPTDLHLTPEQELAVEIWDTADYDDVAAAVGVTRDELIEWENQPLFSLAILKEEMGLEVPPRQLQAVALIRENISFADAEAAIGLDAGAIKKWAKNRTSPFAKLLEEARSETEDDARTAREVERDTEALKLKDQQLLAIPHILAGKTDADVAKAVGTARETINRWRNHDPEFRKELRQNRDAYFDAQMMTLSRVTGKAFDVLENLLDSDDEQIRMRAALHLLRTVSLTHKKKQ